MNGSSFTRPFNLAESLQAKPRVGFDPVPWLDVMLIGCFIAVTSSSLLQLPGATLNLVQSQSLQQSAIGPVTVLTVDRNELLFLGGLKIPMRGLPESLKTAAERMHSRPRTLLIKADDSLSLDEVFNLLQLAKNAGFDHVHLASEPSPAPSDLIQR